MKSRAAVAWEANKPLSIETIEIEGAKAGEVLVEVIATGVCHTDAYSLSGLDSEGKFPAILGHEGAGIVREVEPGVTTLRPGNHVIPLYTPECRQCKTCLSQRSNLCASIRATQGLGLMPDKTTAFPAIVVRFSTTWDARPFPTSPSCRKSHLPSFVKTRLSTRFAIFGCGVTTGIGAVIYTAKVRPGSNVVVFGLGGIGLNVIQGARMVGADKIIGVDINPAKVGMGAMFGMIDFINPKEIGNEKVVQAIQDLTDGGADYSFDATGNVNVMRQALECCHRGWGDIIIGVAEADKEISTRPFQLVTGRVWRGTGLRRRSGAYGCTEDRRLVHGRQDQH